MKLRNEEKYNNREEMKRNSLVHVSVNFWRGNRTEKGFSCPICTPEAFRCKRIPAENVMFTELFK